ncbi:MAG TPA: hypothetical protein VGM22_02220 [Methylomirabilota bacterium]
MRQFLIDNARFYVDEYHVDGFRYDEVTVIDRFGGWSFCQALTDTLHFVRPDLPQIAEYWKDDQSWVVTRDAFVSLDGVAEALRRSSGLVAARQSITHLATAARSTPTARPCTGCRPRRRS